MPDYKLTNVIFTQERPLSKNDLSRNVIYNGEDTIIFFDENNLYRELLNNKYGINQYFMNSYLLEARKPNYSDNKLITKDFPKNNNKQIKFVSFSNMRRPEYQIKTIMREDYVYKYPANEKSKAHIEETKKNIDIIKKAGLKILDTYDEISIISKFTTEKMLDEVIIEQIKQGNKKQAIEIMVRFKNEIKQKLEQGTIQNNVFERYGIECQKEELKSMYFLKNGLWDLIFQNCFYMHQEFYFYDQEWREENLPIDFIMYRAIKYFTRLKKYMTDKELYEILEIDESKIELFDKLDDKIQEKIRNPVMWYLNTQGKSMMDLQRNLLTANHQVNLLKIENSEKDQMILQKDQKIAEKDKIISNLGQQLNAIYHSTSWKVTKPFREIRKGRSTKNLK